MPSRWWSRGRPQRFGFESGAALATVVGVLIAVPVMQFVVRVVNASKGWNEARA